MSLSSLGSGLLGGTNNMLCFVDKHSIFKRDLMRDALSQLGGEWCIYCIFDRESNAVKVGVSTQPIERLSQLQTGNPHRLDLGIVRNFPHLNERGAKSFEREIHTALAPYRMSGGTEWFKCCVEQKKTVERLLDLANRWWAE